MPSLPSRPVDEPFNAVPEMYNVEVYKQSDTFTTEFEVRKDLGLMDRGDAVDRLDFHHHEVLDDQVHSISEIELHFPIDDGKAKVERQIEIQPAAVRIANTRWRCFRVNPAEFGMHPSLRQLSLHD
jgi:hypothetical protein